MQVFQNVGVLPGEVAFSEPESFSVGENADPNFVVSADFNNDAEQDLVTVNTDTDPKGTGGSVSVLLNELTPCPADADGDREVGVNDFLLVLAQWGPCPEGDECPGDTSGDGIVDVVDYLLILLSWGSCD